MSDAIEILRHQRARGPLPVSIDHLSSWIARQTPAIPVEVSLAAVSPLRAVGIVVEEKDGKALAQVPADGDALDRIFSLLKLPPIEGGGAALLLASLEKGNDFAEEPPPLSLPLRVQAAKASSLGWSAELYSLTVLISNVSLRKQDGALLHKGGPVVAVCAEYERPLESLDPPSLHQRKEGIPMLRLPSDGFFKKALRLEPTSRGSRAPRGRPAALARAGKFLDELDDAWQRRIGSVLEIAWPVYRPLHEGPLLDAVVGRPLPEMALR
ncbi:MAG: hypothetical protein ABR567_01980 [Myxococcales bacterium]